MSNRRKLYLAKLARALTKPRLPAAERATLRIRACCPSAQGQPHLDGCPFAADPAEEQ